jgi:hypothetical protein
VVGRQASLLGLDAPARSITETCETEVEQVFMRLRSDNDEAPSRWALGDGSGHHVSEVADQPPWPSDRREARAMSGDTTAGWGRDRARGKWGTVDRREALKKAALAAGVAAWTTPVVQVVSPGTALAQTVTGCSPAVTITLIATGPTCACVPVPVESACCNNNTFWVASLDVDCGPTCPGPATVAGELEFPGVPRAQDCPDRIAEFPCATTATFRATFPVTCPDGQTYQFDGMVTAICQDCGTAAEPPSLIAPNGEVVSEGATPTTGAAAPSASAAPTTTSTQPNTLEAPSSP